MGTASSAKTFRSVGQTILIDTFSIAIAIVGIVTALGLPAAGAVLQAGATSLIAAVGILGPGRATLRTTADGVRIRNTLSTTVIPWREIRGFRIGRHGLLGAVCIIDRIDGSSQHAFAIQVPQSAIGKPDAKARKMVAELNHILENHRANGTP
jgi:hypothetical protein